MFKTNLVGFIAGAFMTAAFATSASAITSSFDFRGPGGTLNPAGSTLTFFDLESNTHDVEVSAWVTVETNN
ncbi:MAG: hypothetical protein OXT01_19385, partial [Rhodospirillaceae bacterium]|nr:hypothetical protein [Rhodospirillaceae bacterium]